MSYDEKKNALFLKRQLILSEKDDLLKFYSDDKYAAFLYLTFNLLNNDQMIVASFNGIKSRILDVINSNRYKNREFSVDENKIIVLLNKLSLLDEYETREVYREINENIRMVSLENDEDLLRHVANDIVLVSILEKDEDTISMDEDKFISSTAFLLKNFQEIYKEKPIALKKTKDHLLSMNKSKEKNTRKKVKMLNKNLKNI